jgi:hypothetical protein
MKKMIYKRTRSTADHYPLVFLALLVAAAFAIAFGLLSVAAIAVTT